MSNQSRQPKGTDAGGQFASTTNPEARVDLSTEATSPYAEGGGRRCVGDIKKLIENLPDDEPVVYWMRFREDAANELGAISDVQEIMLDGTRHYSDQVSPEQWVKIYDRFEEESDSRHGPWSQLHEIFNESVLYVAQDDDDSPVRKMNRDEFDVQFKPMFNPRTGETTFDHHPEDFEFVMKQSADRVWSLDRNMRNEPVIYDGLRDEADGYIVTKVPYDDSKEYEVKNS
jgi:hypothetical protein